ncbi:MAG: glycogen synthase [Candidatus Aminicenantes bacterium]|nr:glycogen synthase [Candidatus Aminicenantes bacterium]
MTETMRVTLITPEAAPFARSGELAEFCAALPSHLTSLGVKASLILPKYSTPQIASLDAVIVKTDLAVPLDGEKVKASVFRAEQKGYEIFLIDNPKYFLRENIYGPPTGNYLDNDERFVFFSRAALEFLRQGGPPVDVLHCNNWPTALIPVFLRSHYRADPALRSVATVLTLHNAAFQGEFPAESLALTELNWDFFDPRLISLNGKFNFLQAGAVYADLINTVSASYEKELLSRGGGFELGGILRRRKKFFSSVRNGLDRKDWDPENDPYIAARFGPGNLEGKAACKRELIEAMGFSLLPESPVLAFVAHLSRYKGADILARSLEGIIGLGAGVIVCGEGEERFQKEFAAAARRFPGRVIFRFESNPVLVHKIMSGSDILLLPSLSEPSGLNLFIAFRYGTVPVARAIGGLKETVRRVNLKTGSGNGFVFRDPTAESLLGAVKRAVACYGEKPVLWQRLMEEGMRQSHSWEETARGYARLYRKALEIKQGG